MIKRKRNGSGYASTLKKIKEEQKEYIKQERERYKNPPIKFEIGEKVKFIKYGREDRIAVIKKINIKTYTIDLQNNFYRVDKFSLSGYPTYLNETGTTSKMFIGELIRIEKV